jgi:hypothetical protein
LPLLFTFLFFSGHALPKKNQSWQHGMKVGSCALLFTFLFFSGHALPKNFKAGSKLVHGNEHTRAGTSKGCLAAAR